MKKNPNKDLRKYHLIFTEAGIICSLLFLIAATNINLGSQKTTDVFIPDSEGLKPIDLPPTIPPETPAPQKPMIFTPKPNNTLIIDELPEFSEFGHFGDQILIPPEPIADIADIAEKIVTYLPVMPTIIGGQKALYSKIKYPEIPRKVNIQGRVEVEFIIDKQGNVTQPRIVRILHPDLDEEVLRVIKLIKFSPGVQNGILVKVKMIQSVKFKLKR